MLIESLETRTLFSFSGADLSAENVAASSLLRLDALQSDPRFSNLNGHGLSVAVLDTGADTGNSAFGADANGNGVADRIVYQYDFADHDADATDGDGHGTNIASIIGSQDARFAGVAPGVNLIILKVFSNASTVASSDAVEAALQWCADNAAAYHIAAVNMSLGSGEYGAPFSGQYANELQKLVNENVIPVAADGNNYYTDNSMPGIAYPASDPNALGVGAVWASSAGGPFVFASGAQDFNTGADHIASFSQRDPALTDIFAPGTMISGAAPGGGSQILSGTSQATAYISGLAVLAQELAQRDLGRSLSFSEFRDMLRSTGATIHDGDDESANVTPTNADYRRADAYGLAQAIELLKPAPPVVRISTPGDFNGDGEMDLFQRDYTTGNDSIAFVSGGHITSTMPAPSAPNVEWRAVATADFNGDGKADIVWRNTATGDNAIWLMNGPVRISVMNLPSAPNMSWTASAAADMDGDHQPDLIWRNTATGDDAAWIIRNGARVSVINLPAAMNTDWRIMAAGDFNRDGKSDLAWRNIVSGENAIWYMNSAVRTSVANLPTAPDQDWRLLGTGPYAGPGHTDLYWQNLITGASAVWVLDGAERASVALI